MSDTALDALAAAVGAAAAVLLSHWLERRAAEKRTISEADMQRIAREA
jgi:hypothetical protein